MLNSKTDDIKSKEVRDKEMKKHGIYCLEWYADQ